MNRTGMLAAVLVAGLGLGYWLAGPTGGPAAQAQDAKGPAGRFTVVETDAATLIVVDNQTNVLNFYTIEKGGKPGDDLHLRGTLDLNGVGGPVLKPKKLKIEDEK